MSEKLMLIGVGVVMILLGWLLLKSYGKNSNRNFTRRCRYCGSTIDAHASICPYCKRKQSFSDEFFSVGGHKKELHKNKLWLGLMLIVMGACFVANALGILSF